MLRKLFTFANLDMDEHEVVVACHRDTFPLSRVKRLTEWLSGPTKVVPQALSDLLHESGGA